MLKFSFLFLMLFCKSKNHLQQLDTLQVPSNNSSLSLTDSFEIHRYIASGKEKFLVHDSMKLLDNVSFQGNSSVAIIPAGILKEGWIQATLTQDSRIENLKTHERIIDADKSFVLNPNYGLILFDFNGVVDNYFDQLPDNFKILSAGSLNTDDSGKLISLSDDSYIKDADSIFNFFYFFSFYFNSSVDQSLNLTAVPVAGALRSMDLESSAFRSPVLVKDLPSPSLRNIHVFSTVKPPTPARVEISLASKDVKVITELDIIELFRSQNRDLIFLRQKIFANIHELSKDSLQRIDLKKLTKAEKDLIIPRISDLSNIQIKSMDIILARKLLIKSKIPADKIYLIDAQAFRVNVIKTPRLTKIEEIKLTDEMIDSLTFEQIIEATKDISYTNLTGKRQRAIPENRKNPRIIARFEMLIDRGEIYTRLDAVPKYFLDSFKNKTKHFTKNDWASLNLSEIQIKKLVEKKIINSFEVLPDKFKSLEFEEMSKYFLDSINPKEITSSFPIYDFLVSHSSSLTETQIRNLSPEFIKDFKNKNVSTLETIFTDDQLTHLSSEQLDVFLESSGAFKQEYLARIASKNESISVKLESLKTRETLEILEVGAGRDFNVKEITSEVFESFDETKIRSIHPEDMIKIPPLVFLGLSAKVKRIFTDAQWGKLLEDIASSSPSKKGGQGVVVIDSTRGIAIKRNLKKKGGGGGEDFSASHELALSLEKTAHDKGIDNPFVTSYFGSASFHVMEAAEKDFKTHLADQTNIEDFLVFKPARDSLDRIVRILDEHHLFYTDLKPENLLMIGDGKGGHKIVLGDLGAINHEIPMFNNSEFSMSFVPPEIAEQAKRGALETSSKEINNEAMFSYQFGIMMAQHAGYDFPKGFGMSHFFKITEAADISKLLVKKASPPGKIKTRAEVYNELRLRAFLPSVLNKDISKRANLNDIKSFISASII